MLRVKGNLLPFGALLLISGFATAQTHNIKISDGEIFSRCYMKMLKTVVPRTASLGNTLMNDIIAKKISGPAACAVLLHQSEFLDNNKLKAARYTGYPKLSEAENQALISTFHNFHNSWFSKKALEFSNANFNNSTSVVKDSDEASLYLTRSLFSTNIPVSNFFTANKTIRGVRVAPDKEKTSRWLSKPMTLVNETTYSGSYPNRFLLSYGTANNLNNLFSIPLDDKYLVPFGKLVGVEDAPSLNIPQITIGGPSMSNTAQRADLNAAIVAKRTGGVNLFEHLGGGILGSQTYILKNTNLTLNQIAPGAANDPDQLIARRLSNRIFEDLLCHQMPTLTEADVINDVKANSPHGFRLNASCMACHTSLDPMATVFRNYASYRTSPNENVSATDPNRPTLMARGTPVLGITKLDQKTGSAVFTLQAPTGSLNYRDHNNRLIKVAVNGTAQLGAELAKSDDFYRCVAKRYYEFFTGYNVNLAERNVAEASNTDTAKFHRQKVHALGASLKQSQSLIKLVEDIINSEGFIYRQYQAP